MNSDHTQKAPDISRSVHLSASAGSGKTRALKERYLALLDLLDRSELGIDQAVAITFTDKAAAEIRERVLQDLPEDMLRKIIRGRQDLRISTIHSFCMNLLKRYPLEAGLPPDFGVLDTRDQADTIRRSIEDALEEADRDAPLMEPLRDFSADGLVAVLEFLVSIRSRLKRLEIDAGGPENLLAGVRRGMGADESLSWLREMIAGGEWRDSLQRMAAILDLPGDAGRESRGAEHLRLSETRDIDAAARIIDILVPVYFTGEGSPRKRPLIPKRSFPAAGRTEYEELFGVIQGLLGAFRERSARVRAGREAFSLLALYFLADERYLNAKLREGLLDFDDLEIYAYRLLTDAASTDILYWLDRKILHFLVDEFQDTSDIQWAVLDRLTGEIFAGEGAAKPHPPTLFVVGDAKQSIYRFREANYRLIDAVSERMMTHLPPAARDIRTLDRNFRSVPEVIGTANRVFAALWGDAYAPSETERSGHRGSVTLLEVLPADGGPSEADVLARKVRTMITNGTVIYGRDAAGWTEQKAGYGDCAVLIQSRTRLKEYEAALRREGVPFRVVGGIGFYEEDEVQAVINVLFFLWNSDDRLALAAALRSQLFGLSEGEILSLFAPGGNAFTRLKELRPAEWALLHGWGRYAGTEPLAGLIHRIIGETGASVRFGRSNPQALFNLDKLLDTARDFDRRGYTTLQDFVEWVRNIKTSEQREATADMNLPGFTGAVSIMTVHKAKGLEFPIVLLPGMNQPPRSVSHGPPVIVESDGRVRMAVRDKENPVYAELWERERGELLQEHQRLLYVAMTRARDHLVMIGTLNGSEEAPVRQNTWLQFFRRAVPIGPAGDRPDTRLLVSAWPEWNVRSGEGEFAGAVGEEQSEQRPQAAVDLARVLGNLAPVPPSEAREWKKATDFLGGEPDPVPGHAGVYAAGPVSPLTRGSILHRCLEEFARNGAVDAGAILQEFSDIQALDEDIRMRFQEEIEQMVLTLTGNKELAWIFRPQQSAWSELPFLFKSGADVVSGIIDRIIVREGKGCVIDYKAISVADDASLQAWMDHYRPQINIYCQAARELFRLDSVEGYLLFLDSARLALTVKA